MTRLVVATTDLPFDPPTWAQLEAAATPDRFVRVDRQDRTAFREALAEAEIAVLGNDLDDDVLSAPKLKWVHVNLSGMTLSARPDIFARGLKVTGVAGRSAPALAEHAMLFMLAINANLRGFEEAQRAHRWGGVEGSRDLRALYGQTVGILGVGFTAKELAIRAKAFGMTVLGYRRRAGELPPGFDRIYSTDRGETIAPILAAADFIVLAINLSDATHHLIDAAALAQMKPNAVIVNLSRGGVIDEAALLDALYARRIRGAGLDVFDTEPLPADSRFWDAPGTLVSPHFSAPVHDRLQRTMAIIKENFRRYRAGEDMLNALTPEDVYTAS
ncbi:MAG: D-2-hydroxyacid dehydrogenase [Devosia sp.]